MGGCLTPETVHLTLPADPDVEGVAVYTSNVTTKKLQQK